MGTIVVSNVSKAYKRYPNKWARMLEWITGRDQHKKTWVLRDINFTIEPGEAVGIVGVNGAGKSTLLKIITGTTQPTTGGVHVKGRVAALLELGMGFHADFTGRQNAYMTGQLLGYSVDEIHALMPKIEAFADIGDYIDQPLRTYSSGMQVRLAFAVSTATRPDILIVDEALSVGDAAFQRKCFRRIEEYKEAGTTLLFVSHDTETVKKICDRAILVNNGIISEIGKARTVCDAYERLLFGAAKDTREQKKEIVPLYDSSLASSSVEVQYGSRGAEIVNVNISDSDGAVTNIIPEGHPIFVSYEVDFKEPADRVNFGMMVKSVDGVCVYATNANANIGNPKRSFQSAESARIRFGLQGNLVPGTYYLNVGVTREGRDKEEMLHRRVDVLIFRVISAHAYSSYGFANLFGNVEVEKK
ncbi:ABC transporter ATP-binding protein [Acidovorax sp. sif1233]|uniref:ABC transporter ATP-binding protein n=1 Tax=unclassified Acidovorax TaxID=2684926 RepID=UPI001C460E1F|nr:MULTISPECIES: ABC transporter ATP-binding protein [unclassified Acidovorax]MBV7428552.1 ABC transporter ATP-binding protein [Acidovorax sp. sif0732]MBV7450378.1 ABC transporter ATP-binding protein [Acidovorax sp. sif0715]MBV7453199.1 ABC transporter ATP-binding protein [Acidovorax sp. sif1233]